VSASTQTTDGVAYGFTYGHDLADHVVWERYPSGRAVMNGYNATGLCSVSGIAGGTPPPAIPSPPYGCQGAPGAEAVYAQSIAYKPHGAIGSFQRGDGVTETWGYNSRLQPASIAVGSLLSLQYGYSATKNNGSPLSQTITRGASTWQQAYTYDGLDRLSTASETSGGTTWSRTFGYDARGNRWVSAAAPAVTAFTPTTAQSFDANNRTTVNGAGYDTAGNQTAIGAYTFTYDAENRLATSTLNGGTTTYVYDGDGRRVKKAGVSATTVYVYDAMGNLAAEYGSGGAAGTRYVSVDALGSTRLVSGSAGGDECYDYLPFGEAIPASVGNRPACYPADEAGPVRFTGKERDTWDENGKCSIPCDCVRARTKKSTRRRQAVAVPRVTGTVSASP
jgi:YD repeat-containing protein